MLAQSSKRSGRGVHLPPSAPGLSRLEHPACYRNADNREPAYPIREGESWYHIESLQPAQPCRAWVAVDLIRQFVMLIR